MKYFDKIVASLLLTLGYFANVVQGCRAEFGEQQMVTGLKAAADLRDYQYRIVRMASALTVNVASNDVSCAAVQMPLGVLQNNPNTDEAASVAIFGMTKIKAGGTVTAGGQITTNGSGFAVDAGSGDVVIGRALETLADGQTGTAFIYPPVRAGSVA